MNKFFHIFLLLVSILILANGSAIVNASTLALTIWFEKLLPSMLVGMVFIRFIVSIGILPWLMRPLQSFTKSLLGLDAGAFSLAVVSVLLGFPASAMMIDEAIGKQELSLDQGQRLILCCCCASSSFIIVTVGTVLYQSITIGVKLWLVQVLSVLTLLLFTRRKHCEFIESETSPHLFSCFAKALVNSINTMLIIAGYLMITLSLCALITPYLPAPFAALLNHIAEFSSGCVLLAQSSYPLFQKLLYTGMLLSFGGLCVHLQILGSCEHAHLSIFRFLLMRLIQCLLAVIFSLILI